MIAVGIAGTRIGGAATYGVAGDVITGGVWNMWWYGISAFLAMALVGCFSRSRGRGRWWVLACRVTPSST